MSAKKYSYWTAFTVAIIAISLAWNSGLVLDSNAEQRDENMYVRDNNGVIDGLQPITVLQGKKRALLFVHGFMESPAMFSDLVDDIKSRVNSDIYVPLLPFHGRDLKSATQFNNKIILDELERTINSLSKKYQSLTVVGMSYGGALLTKLVNEKKIPDTVQIILYAPAFFVTSNNFSGRAETQIYSWWRTYCDYKTLGCKSPGFYPSGDEASRPMFEKEKTLQYTVIPAILQLYQFDLDNRNGLGNIHRPYSIIIAMDDNRVSYNDIRGVCEANQPWCHLYSFPSGKHVIHYGANKKKFEDLLVRLVNSHTHTCADARNKQVT